MPGTAPPVLALNLHAGFECRHSGACCTAGWPVPVEAAVADAIRARGILPGAALSTAGQLPEGAAAVLEPLPGGACPAFDRSGGSLCSIQRELGHEHLPDGAEAGERAWVKPRCAAHAGSIRRYLAARASRPLDPALLHAAIRSADLLLHHRSDAPGLVKSLAGVERGTTSAFLDAIGLEAAG